MSKKYKTFKLLKAQWSWSNDKSGLLVNLALSLILGLILTIKLPITFTVAYVILNFIWITSLYHTLKFIVLGLVCWLVASQANEGNEKAIDYYNEMLTWRK